MKRILFCVMFVMCGLSLCAQSRVEPIQKPDRTIDFQLERDKSPGTKTILFNLLSLSNCTQRLGQYVFVLSSDGVFLTLRPHDARLDIGYDFTYQVIDAWLGAPVELSFAYRLPFSTIRPSRVSIREQDKVLDSAKNYISFSFECEKGDSIFSARRGIVTQIKSVESKENKGVESILQNAYIYVEHADGSIARYVVPDGGRYLTKVGDIVFPDTPLATVGDGKQSSFSVAFYRIVPNNGETANLYPTLLEYFNPVFLTDIGATYLVSGKSYEAVVNDGIIKEEMTEKELKRYDRGKRK